MKKAVILLAAVLVAIGASGQKKPVDNINVRSDDFYYSFRHPQPEKPQDPILFEYGVRIHTATAVRDVYEDEAILGRLKIDGQTRVETPNDLGYVLDVSLPNVIVLGATVSEGPEFKMLIQYEFTPKVKFTRGETDLTLPEMSWIYTENKSTFSTKAFKTAPEARTFWADNKEVIKTQIVKKAVDDAIRSINESVSDNYGFLIQRYVGWPNYVKLSTTKEHAETASLRENAEALRKKLEALDGTRALTDDEMAPMLDYYKSVYERYTGSTKADTKLRYIACYNLSRAYLLMDRPEMAIQWAEKLIANGHDPKDGEKFIKEANKLMDLFLKSYYKSRQF